MIGAKDVDNAPSGEIGAQQIAKLQGWFAEKLSGPFSLKRQQGPLYCGHRLGAYKPVPLGDLLAVVRDKSQYGPQVVKIKEQKACTEQDREQLRTQLREAVKDQTRDREQLRERLQVMRESLPSHEQVMEQAREQVQARDRRGE